MKTIRKNVFETNSSSTHSISIEIGPNWDTITPNENGKINLYGGEFGWEWRRYDDALTKANYCAISCERGYTNFTKKDLKNAIKEFTGATKVKFKFSTDWNNGNYSYIDHQSDDTLQDLTASTLKDFIFNKSSILYTGNDNDSAPSNFYDSPDTVYKYELKVLGESIKFQEMPSIEQIKEFIDKHLDYRETLLEVNLEEKSFTYGINVSSFIESEKKLSKESWDYYKYQEVQERLQNLSINQRQKNFLIIKL